MLGLSDRLQEAGRLGWVAEGAGIPGQGAVETTDCEASK